MNVSKPLRRADGGMVAICRRPVAGQGSRRVVVAALGHCRVVASFLAVAVVS
jgi:hypothetical protein